MASAQSITVGPTSSYKTIQSALNAARAGDTIIVSGGTYYENVMVDKTVTIKAAGGATVIVDAGQRYPAFFVRAGNVWIEGFTVRNGGPSYSGFYVSGSGATIVNNRISGCGWGVFLTSGTGSTVRGNTVDGSTSVGVCLRSSNGNTILRNTVTNCAKGLSIEGTSSSNRIYLNDFNNGYSVSGVTNTFNAPAAQSYVYHGKTYSGILGNRWASYQSTDLNGNGLGDKVFYGTGFQDNYPLMETQSNFATGGTSTPVPTGTPTVTPAPTAKPTVTPAPTATPTPPPTGGPIYINPAVPANAVRVSSQAEINALSAGANAVLAVDLSSLTISKSVNLFGAGHRVGTLTFSTGGIRVSGVNAGAVVFNANDCTLDHSTVTATSSVAIKAARVNNIKILSNTVNGPRTSSSYGIYVTNCTGAVVDGNKVTGAYMGIDLYGCVRPQVSYNFIGHVTGFRQGIDIYAESITGGVIRGNEVEFNAYHGPGHAEDHDGMGFRYLDGVTIENNKIGGHYYGMKVYLSKNCVIQSNNLVRVGSLRTGFYDKNLIVRNNKIQGEAAVGYSVGLYINDGIYNCTYEGNEVWDCQYAVEVTHYPPGTKYLEGWPSTPCSYIYLKNNFLHHSKVAFGIADKGATIESGNRVENCQVVRSIY